MKKVSVAYLTDGWDFLDEAPYSRPWAGGYAPNPRPWLSAKPTAKTCGGLLRWPPQIFDPSVLFFSNFL